MNHRMLIPVLTALLLNSTVVFARTNEASVCVEEKTAYDTLIKKADELFCEAENSPVQCDALDAQIAVAVKAIRKCLNAHRGGQGESAGDDSDDI